MVRLVVDVRQADLVLADFGCARCLERDLERARSEGAAEAAELRSRLGEMQSRLLGATSTTVSEPG